MIRIVQCVALGICLICCGSFFARMLVAPGTATVAQSELTDRVEIPSLSDYTAAPDCSDLAAETNSFCPDDDRAVDVFADFFAEDCRTAHSADDLPEFNPIVQTAYAESDASAENGQGADQPDAIPPATPAPVPGSAAPGFLRISSTTDHRQAIEAVVHRHFPDLDADTRAGWLDAYSEMSVQEVELLLTEKKQMPQIAPLGSYLRSEFLSPAAKIRDPSVKDPLLRQMVAVSRQNLMNVETVGYRRQQLRTRLTGLSSGTSAERMVMSPMSHEFSRGRVSSSGSPLHFRIVANNAAMFRLEPGCVLTRNGRFERLNDGRIGMTSGDQSLTLHGDLRVPEDASNIQLNEDGMLTCQLSAEPGEEPTVHQIGQLQIAVVTDTTQLKSQNGVFFSVANGDIKRHVQMSDSIDVVQHSLELSNVDAGQEYDTLDRIERLQR